ncbi:MAG: hypothetical protein HKM23_08150 [Nitrosopumilus sp.]|nr:hypothetical protein [Nitrosopumilus sp.]
MMVYNVHVVGYSFVQREKVNDLDSILWRYKSIKAQILVWRKIKRS